VCCLYGFRCGFVSALNEANERNAEKSSLSLEEQLRVLLSRLDVLNVVRTREFCGFYCRLTIVHLFCGFYCRLYCSTVLLTITAKAIEKGKICSAVRIFKISDRTE